MCFNEMSCSVRLFRQLDRSGIDVYFYIALLVVFSS